MSSNDSFNRSKTLEVFESLLEMGFQGQTIQNIAVHTGMSYQSIRRCLIVLKNHGWIAEAPLLGSRQQLWKPAEKLIKAAFQFKRYNHEKISTLERDYLSVTGEVLANDK